MDFIATDDEGKAVQMVNTTVNLGGFLGALGLLATDPLVVQQAADSAYFRALVNLQKTVQQFGTALTNWKNYERDGGPVALLTPALPVQPPGFPVAVAPGIIARYRFFANYIKAQPTYAQAIGLALGIEGGHSSAPDLTTVQPVITAKITGGQTFIGWTFSGLREFVDMIEIFVDRHDTKGRVFLTRDTTPGYTDTTPFPATPTVWTYDATWIVGDARVGLTSNPVSITVG